MIKMNKNDFASRLFMALGLIYVYIKNHVANISLGLAVLLILRYLLIVFNFEIMTLGIAVCLLIVSLTNSLPQKEEKRNDRRY